MEAATKSTRKLDSEKAQRIVEAMRRSVASRGAAGATFDHVAQEAGVSRGLLHYYFGSKERLLVEVVRHDTEERMEALDRRLGAAGSIDEIVEVLVTTLHDLLDHDPEGYALVFELFTASRHNDELREAVSSLYSEIRSHVTEVLQEKHREGVVKLAGDAEAVAATLLALGDGIAVQVLSDPEWSSDAAFEVGAQTARGLLGAGA